MDSLETDDQLTIVNRSTEYSISKQLLRKVPYFEKMLSHDLKESKESKVELDVAETALKIILDWVERGCTIILIEMSYVLDLYELADYFGLDSISKECITYFHDNFSIAHLPIVIPKVTPTSKFIKSGALNAFICRHFLMIANTYLWLNYPIETIEFICALELRINSEIQVFNAIIRWASTRNNQIKRLLKLVRWCHLNEEDLFKIKENELFKSSGFEPIFCSPRKVNCDCTFDRTKQNYFVMIEELPSKGKSYRKDMRIKVLDNNFKLLVSQVIKDDYSIPGNLFHDEHISDIYFDSGKYLFRIDWKQNKFIRLYPREPYTEIQKKLAFNVECGIKLSGDYVLYGKPDGYLLLEAAENFVLIYNEAGCLRFVSRPICEHFKNFVSLNSCKATYVDNKIYLMTEDTLYEYKIEIHELKQTWNYRLLDKEFRFNYSLLTPSPVGDKIILIDEITKNYICFDVNTKVKSKGRMISYSSVDGQKDSDKLFTFTSTFLPLNTIRNYLKLQT